MVCSSEGSHKEHISIRVTGIDSEVDPCPVTVTALADLEICSFFRLPCLVNPFIELFNLENINEGCNKREDNHKPQIKERILHLKQNQWYSQIIQHSSQFAHRIGRDRFLASKMENCRANNHPAISDEHCNRHIPIN